MAEVTREELAEALRLVVKRGTFVQQSDQYMNEVLNACRSVLSRLDAENGVQTREQKAVELCRRLTHVHDGCLPGECNYSIMDIITEADALFDAEQGQEQHCELFTTKRGEMQDCMSDGHYECRACSRLDPDSDIARLDAERG